MKYGTVFPGSKIGFDPIAVRDFAQAVEGMGYDYLLTYEELMTDGNPKAIIYEAFTLFSFLAMWTEELDFATGIMVLPKRQTVLVAKQAAQVDLFSGGRLRLGFSVGWKRGEYQALGADFRTRGARIEEQIAVLRELWTQPAVTFRGDYHTIEGLGINPLPVQRPIPIWMGGFADAVLQRAARLGDGWMATLPPEQFRSSVTKLHTYLAQTDRDRRGFGISNHIYMSETPAERWASLLGEWHKLGVTHVEFSTMGCDLDGIDGHLAALHNFIDRVQQDIDLE